MTDDHEDNIINTNRLRLSSVPNPTTRRKKKDEKANRNKQTNKWDIDEHTNTHITSHIDQSSQHLQQIQEKQNEEKKLVTVAYIIIIPNDDGFDDDNDSNKEGNNSSSARNRRQYRAMKALAKSIEVAHIESKYDYHLYALSLGSLKLSSMRECSKLGIETIVVNETDLNGSNSVVDMSVVDMATEPTSTAIENRRLNVVELNENDGEEEGRVGLLGMLNQNDIIVQLSLNSIMFHSMDDVFDTIMGMGHRSDIVGIVESHSDVDGGRKEERVIERLELTNSAFVNDSDLNIFKSTSQREHTSFLNRLACQLSKKQRMTKDADQGSSMSADCSTWIANEDGRLLLDRCIYDVGVFDGWNCFNTLTLDDIRLARFSGKLVEPHSNDTNVDQEEDKASSCRTPWEYRSEVKCLNDHVGHVNEKMCYYLCEKWFQLVDIS
jgi:hypothetical protein